MAFTGRLGTEDSQLGDIVLGRASGAAFTRTASDTRSTTDSVASEKRTPGQFPAVRATSALHNDTVIATSHAVPLPTTGMLGDLLLMLCRTSHSSTAFTQPSGWSTLFNEVTQNESDRHAVFYRFTDGSEGSSVTVTHGNSEMVAIVWRISAASAIAGVSSRLYAETQSPNPPALTLGSARNYLWFAMVTTRGERLVSSYPSGYTLGQRTAQTEVDELTGSNATMGGAARQLTAASEDPANFTLQTSSAETISFTLAIAPIGGVANFPRPVADSTPTSDAVARSGVFTRTATDTVTTNDSISGAQTRTATDTTSVTDAVERTIGQTRTASDAVTVSDSITELRGTGRQAADTTSVTDSVAGAVTATRTATDTTSVTDAVASYAAGARTATDSTAVTESVGHFIAATRTPVDTVTTTDDLDHTTDTAGLSRTAVDTVTTGDALSAAQTLTRALADTTAVSEAIASGGATTRFLTDSTSVSDAAVVSVAIVRTVTDSVPFVGDSMNSTTRSTKTESGLPLGDEPEPWDPADGPPPPPGYYEGTHPAYLGEHEAIAVSALARSLGSQPSALASPQVRATRVFGEVADEPILGVVTEHEARAISARMGLTSSGARDDFDRVVGEGLVAPCDRFGRVVASGWGTGPMGTYSGAGTTSVDGNLGILSSIGATRYVTTIAPTDPVSAVYKLRAPVNGDYAAGFTTTGRTSLSTGFSDVAFFTVKRQGGNVLTGLLAGGAQTQQSVSITNAYSGQWVWVRLTRNGTTVSVKFWLDGTTEPADPMLSITHANIGFALRRFIFQNGSVSGNQVEFDQWCIESGLPSAGTGPAGWDSLEGAEWVEVDSTAGPKHVTDPKNVLSGSGYGILTSYKQDTNNAVGAHVYTLGPPFPASQPLEVYMEITVVSMPTQSASWTFRVGITGTGSSNNVAIRSLTAGSTPPGTYKCRVAVPGGSAPWSLVGKFWAAGDTEPATNNMTFQFSPNSATGRLVRLSLTNDSNSLPVAVPVTLHVTHLEANGMVAVWDSGGTRNWGLGPLGQWLAVSDMSSQSPTFDEAAWVDGEYGYLRYTGLDDPTQGLELTTRATTDPGGVGAISLPLDIEFRCNWLDSASHWLYIQLYMGPDYHSNLNAWDSISLYIDSVDGFGLDAATGNQGWAQWPLAPDAMFGSVWWYPLGFSQAAILAAGVRVKVHVDTTGSFAKAWLDGTAEPAGWQIKKYWDPGASMYSRIAEFYRVIYFEQQVSGETFQIDWIQIGGTPVNHIVSRVDRTDDDGVAGIDVD